MTYTVIEMPKRLDAPRVSKMREQVIQAFQEDVSLVVLDFKNCDFVDSRGLSVVVTGLKQSRQLDKMLKLVHVGEEVQLLLRITRFDRICDIHETMAGALGNSGAE